MREAMGDCDAIAHMAALKIPRYGGALKTLAVNVDGSHVALELGREIGAHVVLASTSDVYGQAEPPFHEDDPIVLGPPTTRRWSYAASKYYDEHLALRMAEEEGLKVTILRFFNAYGIRNHAVVVGRPAVGLLRGPARRQGHGDPRRRPPDPLVHLRERHGRRRRPRPGASGDLRRGHQHRQRPADRDHRARPQGPGGHGHRGRRCASSTSASRRSAATTRTSGTACPTSPRPGACSASSRRCRSRRAWPRPWPGTSSCARRPSRPRERARRHRSRRAGGDSPARSCTPSIAPTRR